MLTCRGNLDSKRKSTNARYGAFASTCWTNDGCVFPTTKGKTYVLQGVPRACAAQNQRQHTRAICSSNALQKRYTLDSYLTETL